VPGSADVGYTSAGGPIGGTFGDMVSHFDNLPIIPHEEVADVDCCGCLMVRLREREADILCNECGVVIRTIAIKEVESAMLEMARTNTICSARCPHAGR
jgi:hypothetical protein